MNKFTIVPNALKFVAVAMTIVLSGIAHGDTAELKEAASNPQMSAESAKSHGLPEHPQGIGRWKQPIESNVLYVEFQATVVDGGSLYVSPGEVLHGNLRIPLSLPDLDATETIGHYEVDDSSAADVHHKDIWAECCTDDGDVIIIWAHDGVDEDGTIGDSFQVRWTSERMDETGAKLGDYTVELKLVDQDGDVFANDRLPRRLTLNMFNTNYLHIFPVDQESSKLVARISSIRTILAH